MSRPSDAEVADALRRLAALVRNCGEEWPETEEQAVKAAIATLRAAVKPRELWPSLEVCAHLGIESHALPRVRGLPAPAQVLHRPGGNPRNEYFKQWDADEIRELKRELDARKATSGGRSDG